MTRVVSVGVVGADVVVFLHGDKPEAVHAGSTQALISPTNT